MYTHWLQKLLLTVALQCCGRVWAIPLAINSA